MHPDDMLAALAGWAPGHGAIPVQCMINPYCMSWEGTMKKWTNLHLKIAGSLPKSRLATRWNMNTPESNSADKPLA